MLGNTVPFSSRQTGKLKDLMGLTLYTRLLLAGTLWPVQGWLRNNYGFVDSFTLAGKEDHIFFISTTVSKTELKISPLYNTRLHSTNRKSFAVLLRSAQIRCPENARQYSVTSENVTDHILNYIWAFFNSIRKGETPALQIFSTLSVFRACINSCSTTKR